MRTPLTLLLVSSLLLVAACGQKGPLTLPDQPLDTSSEQTQEQG